MPKRKIDIDDAAPVRGSHLRRDDAKLLAQHFRRMARGGRSIVPETVVDAARSKNSPLHRFFEWDDSKAAEAHRLDQARYLLRSVKVIVEMPTGPVESRAVVSVDHEYRVIEQVLSSAALRQLAIEQALRELGWWEARYQRFQELDPVFAAAARVRRR